MKVDGSAVTQPVSITAIPLPSGAATDANLAAILAKIVASPALEGGNLASINTKLGGTLAVSGTFWQATQPVTATALPLPAGAATSALQATLGTKLDTLHTDMQAPTPAGTNLIGSVTTIDATLVAKGFFSGTISTAATLASLTGGTVPANTRIAIIQPETYDIRIRDDGTAPTATTGLRIYAGEKYRHLGSMANLQIVAVATAATVNILLEQ